MGPRVEETATPRSVEIAGDERETEDAGVFLTFDDGPDPVWTRRVLDELRRAGARATFFVIAPLARRYPRLVREISRSGHGVEFHCSRHVRHTEQSRREVELDTRSGLRDLKDLGIRPRLWRPPWGVLAPWSRTVAEEAGLELILWTADTHDWRGDSAREMLDAVSPALVPGAVVLMHDGLGPGARRAGCEETVALIPELVETVRARGCEPLPLTAPGPAKAPREASA